MITGWDARVEAMRLEAGCRDRLWREEVEGRHPLRCTARLILTGQDAFGANGVFLRCEADLLPLPPAPKKLGSRCCRDTSSCLSLPCVFPLSQGVQRRLCVCVVDLAT